MGDRKVEAPTHKSWTPVVQVNRYTIREENHQGRKHIVVPVVMMVEGVHSGSHGPILHSAEYLRRFPEAWNGIPVVVHHPERDGMHVSANSPDIVEEEVVGRIFNTNFSDGKLRAEAWLDEEKLSNVSIEALTYIRELQPLDVSVGVFTEDVPEQGQWNGETYTAIATNHRPDHLALLPGAQGACSWADGCGVRVNSEKQGGTECMNLTFNEQGVLDLTIAENQNAIKDLVQSGYSIVQVNGGYRRLMSTIQSKLDMMDTDTRVHMLEDVYDGYFIYRVAGREAAGQSTLYKRDYTYNENDESVEFGENVTPVRKKVDYVEVQNNNSSAGQEDEDTDGDKKVVTFRRTKFNNKGGAQDMAKCNCAGKVDSLIQSNTTSFDESDRNWLETLEEGQVDKLITLDKEKQDALQANAGGDGEEKKEVTKEEAISVLKQHLSDPNEFMKLLPQETREQMQHGMRLHKAHRSELISTLSSNQDAYSEDELNNMSTEELEKLSKIVKPQANYSGIGSGQGSAVTYSDNEEEVLLPIGVNEKSEGGQANH